MEKKTKKMKKKEEKQKGKKVKKKKEKITFGHLCAEGQAVTWHKHTACHSLSSSASTESCRCWFSGVRHQKEGEGSSGASWKLFLKPKKKVKNHNFLIDSTTQRMEIHKTRAGIG